MTGGFPARLERFDAVDSTQRVVAEWLAGGTPEVAVAVADIQTEGRGRQGRRWDAPPGTALLCSCGFRPEWLAPRHAWQVPAVVALAMLDACEAVAGLRDGTLGLKWPNDLVAAGPGATLGAEPASGEAPGGAGGAAGPSDELSGGTRDVEPQRRDAVLLKFAGVLGETTLAGSRLRTAVVGIGVNVDWGTTPFPAQLVGSATTLAAVAHRPVDREQLLGAFLARLEPRYEALAAGRFDAAAWSMRQRTTDRVVEIALGDRRLEGLAVGVDPDSGALLVMVEGVEVAIDAGEVLRCRLRG